MELIRNFFKKVVKNEINNVLQDSEFENIIERMENLCNKNILDFSSKLVYYIVINELVNYFKIDEVKTDHSKIFSIFIRKFYEIMKEYLRRFIGEQSKNGTSIQSYYNLINVSLYFIIILINLKEYRNMIVQTFDKNSKIVKQILEILEHTANFESNKRIAKIYCNLYLDEYKSLFFKHELDELFIYNNEKFTKLNTEGVDVYPKTIYKNLLTYLCNIDMTYQVLLSCKKYDHQDKSIVKIILIQSILRVVFSKEKYNIISENDYEIIFLTNIINKSIAYYKNKYGNKINCLFREDEIFDDLLKNILFIFGNSMLNKSMIRNIKNLFIESEDFSFKPESILPFFDIFICELEDSLPNIIKIVLKLIYDNLVINYPNDNHYSPIFTYLMFNFLNSPKFQEINNLHPSFNKNIKDLNLILRNIYFNKLFPESDPYSKLNHIIKICNEKLVQTIDKIIESIKDQELNSLIKENNTVFDQQPKFLFYYDTAFILRVVKRVEGFNLHNSIKILILVLVEITTCINKENIIENIKSNND